jgi:hypothetical protein
MWFADAIVYSGSGHKTMTMTIATEQQQEQRSSDGAIERTAEMLEEWWQREYAKRKPLDPSYWEFTFDPNNSKYRRRGSHRNE